MTSMAVAPKPIRSAHQNPRRVPSFRIVKLTGPTGIERKNPLMNPVKAAIRIDFSSGMDELGCEVSRRINLRAGSRVDRRPPPPRFRGGFGAPKYAGG